jgi:predicted HTH domain antitoxin
MSVTDGGPTQPSENGFGEGFGEWQEIIEQVVDPADLEEFFDATADIQQMSPEERFTESANRFHAVFVDEGVEEDVNAVVSGVESSPISKEMFEAFDEVWTLLQKAMLKQLEQSREDEIPRLLFALYLEKAQNAFVATDNAIEDSEQIDRPVSTLIALSSLLLEVIFEGEEVDREEMFRDVLRADYYMDQSGSPLLQSPGELSEEDVREKVLVEAAVLAYERLNISVGRGAELAGISVPEFEEELDRHGIRPNYGPEHLDDLVSESSLFPTDTDESGQAHLL